MVPQSVKVTVTDYVSDSTASSSLTNMFHIVDVVQKITSIYKKKKEEESARMLKAHPRWVRLVMCRPMRLCRYVTD